MGRKTFALVWRLVDAVVLSAFAQTSVVAKNVSPFLPEHADAFACDNCEPLVSTLADGVFANQFPSARKTVWTLDNANQQSLNDETLPMPHGKGARDIPPQYLTCVWNVQTVASGLSCFSHVKFNRVALFKSY